jgi:hypothetical protein
MDKSATDRSLASGHVESRLQHEQSSNHRRIIRVDIMFNVIHFAEVSNPSISAISPDSHEDVMHLHSGTLVQIIEGRGSPIAVHPSNDIIYLGMNSKDYSLFGSVYPNLVRRAKFVAIDFGDPATQFNRLFSPVKDEQTGQFFGPFQEELQELLYISTGGEEGCPGIVEFKVVSGLQEEYSPQNEMKNYHASARVSMARRVQIEKDAASN